MTSLPHPISGHRDARIGAGAAAVDGSAAVLAAAFAYVLATFLDLNAGVAAAIGVAYFGFTVAVIHLMRRIPRDEAN